MSGNKKRGSSSVQSKCPKLPSTMPEKELVKGHEIEFNVSSITKSVSIFKCDVGGASFDGRPLTAIKCSNFEEVDGYFKRGAENDYWFAPIIAYTHEDKILLLGEYVGERFEDWVKGNQGTLFTPKGEFTNVAITVGKQIFEIVTTNHQKGEFLGNIQEKLYINSDFKLILIPCLDTAKISDVKDGIKKDLTDLRWFMGELEEQAKKSATLSSSTLEVFSLFLNLFPRNLSLQEDENKLRSISYIICHNPIFWGYRDRYLFSGIAKTIYKQRNVNDNDLFMRLVPINQGSTNVKDWWNHVIGLPRTSVLRRVYNYGVTQISTTYDDEGSIIPFIRNTMEHCQQQVSNITLEAADNEIIEAFPNVHLKIYVAMASTNMDNGLYLDSRLQDGKLNYYK